MLVRIEQHELGRRFYIGHRERRIHHYHVGSILIAIGVGLIWVDLEDLLETLRN